MPEETGKSRIPIVEERPRIDKHVVPTGRVRITSRADARVQLVRDELVAQTVAVERVPIDREVDSPPGIRTEGDVLIIPVVEERLVVEKRWVVTEELRVRRQEHTEALEIPVELRFTHVCVERTDATPQPDTTSDDSTLLSRSK